MRHELLIGVCVGGLFAHVHGQEWVRTSAPASEWVTVASSADGSKLAGTTQNYFQTNGGIYISTNAGLTWTRTGAPTNNWWCLASSADGKVLAASITENPPNNRSGPIYFSTNSGATWNQSDAPIQIWSEIASSADGTKLVAVGDRSVYTSVDSGATWVQQVFTPESYWYRVSSSADGIKLVATGVPLDSSATNNFVFVSTNSGVTWNSRITPAPARVNWWGVSSSADGAKLVATGQNDQGIYQSVDSGVTWTTIYPVIDPTNQFSMTFIAASADGSVIARADLSQEILLSTNSGASWDLMLSPEDSSAVALSADGSQFVMVGRESGEQLDGIYIRQTTPKPTLRIAQMTNQLDLSWVIPTASFALQQISDLKGTNWSSVPETPFVANLYYHVLVPAPTVNTYYRLAASR